MKLLLGSIVFLICSVQVFSQTLEDDLNAVRAICDSNNLGGINIDLFIEVENDRVVSLVMEADMVVFIIKMPADLGRLTALKKFVLLGFDEFESLPPEIGNLKALDSLVVVACALKDLPKEIGDCSALKYLCCTGNRYLTSLPSQIGNLLNLKELKVTSAGLIELPSEIGNLTSLISLMVSGNSITELPSEIGNLESLIKLDVSFNNLIAIPASVGNISVLSKLYLHCNSISSLPSEICNYTNLLSFHIDRNKLISLPNNIGNLTSLIKLNLSKNSLTALPASINTLNLPQGPDGINLCFNPDLTFTPEQQTWADAKDYAEYEDKYCDVGIEEFTEKENKSPVNTIDVLPGSIVIHLCASGHTRLEIYTVSGKKLSTLVDGFKYRGKYTVSWKVRQAGVYLVKLSSGKASLIKKIIVTR